MAERFADFITNSISALPLPSQASDRIAVVRNNSTYYELLSGLVPGIGSYLYSTPATGDTITAAEGLGSYVFDPAGAIDALNVVLPPTPDDGQLFELSTSQDIMTLTVTAPDATVGGGAVGTLAANGGCSWRYVFAEAKWFRRY